MIANNDHLFRCVRTLASSSKKLPSWSSLIYPLSCFFTIDFTSWKQHCRPHFVSTEHSSWLLSWNGRLYYLVHYTSSRVRAARLDRFPLNQIDRVYLGKEVLQFTYKILTLVELCELNRSDYRCTWKFDFLESISSPNSRNERFEVWRYLPNPFKCLGLQNAPHPCFQYCGVRKNCLPRKESNIVSCKGMKHNKSHCENSAKVPRCLASIAPNWSNKGYLVELRMNQTLFNFE